MLLAAVDEEAGGSRLSDKQVRDEVVTLMLAGHDTTAAGLDWLWYNLARYPDVTRRCQDEIDQQIGSRKPVASDVSRLAYVEATIKENLRLYPPAIGVFLRQATSDLEIGGYDVSRGSLVTLSSFVTHRDARWFPDPMSFDPSRFLEPNADRIPPGAYFPFGAGPRTCIGQGFAMTEMTLIAATLLQRCDPRLSSPHSEPQLHVHMSLRPSEPVTVRWTRRLGQSLSRETGSGEDAATH